MNKQIDTNNFYARAISVLNIKSEKIGKRSAETWKFILKVADLLASEMALTLPHMNQLANAYEPELMNAVSLDAKQEIYQLAAGCDVPDTEVHRVFVEEVIYFIACERYVRGRAQTKPVA